jgi:hypothetical protein
MKYEGTRDRWVAHGPENEGRALTFIVGREVIISSGRELKGRKRLGTRLRKDKGKHGMVGKWRLGG